MDLLERFRSEAPPRSDALCEPLVKRFVPLFGIVAYGAIYLFVSPLPWLLFHITAQAFMRRLHIAPEPSALRSLLSVGGGLVVYAASWAPFVAWAARWRSSRRRFFREALVLEAQFLGTSLFGRHSVSLYRFVHDGVARTVMFPTPKRSDDSPAPTEWVLYHPDVRFGFIFWAGDLLYVSSWRSDTPVENFSAW